jgi:phosphocarrier protein HPr
MTGHDTAEGHHTFVRDFEIVNQRGLHARASAKFVSLVSGFNALVNVEKDGVTVGGTSIMGLMMLAASLGCCIRVSASGPEAADVMAALEALIASRFGEEI